MAKRSALARAAANFNKRIERELRKNPAAASYLPEKVRARELKKTIVTPRENQRVVRELNRFTADAMNQLHTTPKGMTVTKWELERVKRANKRANAYRQQELAARSLKEPDFKTRTGELEKLRLKPRAVKIHELPNTQLGKDAWRAFAKTELTLGSEAYRQRNFENYKQVYIKNVKANLGARDSRELVALIQQLPAEKVYRAQYNDPILTIAFTSPPVDTKALASMAMAHWLGVSNPEMEEFF